MFRASDRRDWLSLASSASASDSTTAGVNSLHIDPKQTSVTYEEFVHKELIHYSLADNYRSLPSVVDGLKPSQR